MIDLHTHILPGMDDGSKTPAESEQMLCKLKNQGVNVVVATPHFYADGESPQEFLRRRQKAFARLPKSDLQILLGAEVAYFSGMSRCEELPMLCIEGTNLLLVEMPFESWQTSVVDEVCMIPRRFGITPVLAHIDRYCRIPGFSENIAKLLKCELLLQCNAEGILPCLSGRRMLRMIRDGLIHFIGSDCHGMTRRAPNMCEAIAKMEKKLGASQLRSFCDRAAELLT